MKLFQDIIAVLDNLHRSNVLLLLIIDSHIANHDRFAHDIAGNFQRSTFSGPDLRDKIPDHRNDLRRMAFIYITPQRSLWPREYIAFVDKEAQLVIRINKRYIDWKQ